MQLEEIKVNFQAGLPTRWFLNPRWAPQIKAVWLNTYSSWQCTQAYKAARQFLYTKSLLLIFIFPITQNS